MTDVLPLTRGDAFVLAKVEALLQPVPNRLDTSNRRSRIVAAAAYENLHNNFAKLNVRDVAKRAGVSTATLYRIFPDERTLYRAGYDLANDLYRQWLFRESNHPNPLFRFSEMLSAWVEMWPRPMGKNIRPGRFVELDRRDAITSVSTKTFFKTALSFWLGQIRRLTEERYLDFEPTYATMEELSGPLEALIFFPTILTCQTFRFEMSAFEYAWRTIDDFMRIHGTPYFHATRRRLNWDDDLVAFRLKFK